MAQFELLDAILSESGSITDQDEVVVVNESDAVIFSGIDQLVESAMRETLRNTILESTIDDSTKLGHIEIIENANFSDEQILSFMEGTINPILDAAGFLNESHDLGGSDPVAVSAPVYEAALALHLNSTGELSESIIEAELIESASELEGDERATFVSENFDIISQTTGSKDSLYHQIFEGTNTESEFSVLQDAFAHIFEKYEMDETEAEAVVTEAAEFLETHGVENLQMDLGMIAEAVVDYNAIAESTGYATFDVVLEDVNSILYEYNDMKDSEFDRLYKNKGKGPIIGKKGSIRRDINRGKKVAQMRGDNQTVGAAKGVVKGAYTKTRVVTGKLKDSLVNSKAGKKVQAGLDYVSNSKAGQKVKAGAAYAGDKASQAKGWTAGKFANAKSSVINKATATKDHVVKNKGKYAGGAVAVAAVATAAAIAYKKFAGRECAGLAGDEKSKCMKSAAAQGLKAAKAQAKSCDNERCVKSAQAEISKWESKMANA